MIAPARLAAYTALRAVTAGRVDLPEAIARTRATLSDERDRALAAEVVTGALRWQAALDHAIARLTQKSVSRLDGEILDILRLGAYQLLYLDRVPARAVVDDSVDLARKAGKHSAAGLVNAVLRSIARAGADLELPTLPESPIAVGEPRARALDYLSVTLSHPRWLAARWLDRVGLEAAADWMRFNNTAAPLTLRANRLKTSREDLAQRLASCGVVVEPARYAPDALLVRSGNPLATPLASTGEFLLQDEASQLVALFAGARPGEMVLDTCAAPGGKTTAMAADMADSGLLVATDVRDARLDLLRRTVAASGATRVRLARNDMRSGLSFGARFDLVLVDAPCSGLGTLRRDPDIKWRRTEEALPQFQAIELAILETAAGGVRPGGRLVYATCSSEPDENDQVVDIFLSRHPEFAPRDPRNNPESLPEGLLQVLDEAGRLRTVPHQHGLEAFFAALLVRES